MRSVVSRGVVGVAVPALVVALGVCGLGDTVTLKTGGVYRGVVDKDNTLLMIFDGLRRVVIRDTKVTSVESETLAAEEVFKIDQPLVTHTGEMPEYAIAIRAGEWDEAGRRLFSFIGQGSTKPVRMTQAINELGPKQTRIRGVDGYWRGIISTSEIPRPVVLALLRQRDQADQGERLKIGRFLIQAEWYPEALEELEGIARDFPALESTVATVAASVRELQAQRIWKEIDRRHKAGQPRNVQTLLASFPSQDVSPSLLEQVRLRLEEVRAQGEIDRGLAQGIRQAAEGLSESRKGEMRPALLAMLRELDGAPDAVRERFRPFLERSADPAAGAEAKFALALSGWAAGGERASEDLDTAKALWDARGLLSAYLTGRTESDRGAALEALRALKLPGKESGVDPGLLAELARNSPPALRQELNEQPGKPRRLRVLDDTNNEPTEYVVILPPEYHPVRRYPALIVLHGGEGPEATLGPWAELAAERGVILIAPEYNLRGQPKDYRYTPSEHAAVELTLRDARKRFALDSNRVFLAGMLLGGNMAWDLGMSHPDLFAGVAVISGLPAKYVWANKENTALVPLYVAMGAMAPTEPELILPLGTSLISRNYDVIYTEYYWRGLEALPEEIPRIFEWMEPRAREPYRKEFSVTAGRDCDDRFFGVVIREFDPDRSKPPEQVDPLGKNLKPATLTRTDRTLANLLDVQASGVDRIDLWFGPPYLDVNERLEIRINGKSAFRGRVPLDLSQYLEDLRLRGDREQVYWVRYAAEVGRSRR